MDIRMASTSARFGFVFARRGITLEAAASWFLPRLVGMQTALEWCMTGRVFDADEALAHGLVRSLHTSDELVPAARALAREIADHAAPVSVALTRQMLWWLSAAPHPMFAHRIDSRSIQSRGRSADVREGVGAFLEKRPAVFPDRVSTDMPPVLPMVGRTAVRVNDCCWWGSQILLIGSKILLIPPDVGPLLSLARSRAIRSSERRPLPVSWRDGQCHRV